MRLEVLRQLYDQSVRSLPLLGGAVGGASDGYTTREVGRRARRAFLPSGE